MLTVAQWWLYVRMTILMCVAILLFPMGLIPFIQGEWKGPPKE